MISKKISVALISALFLVALTACSLFSPKGSAVVSFENSSDRSSRTDITETHLTPTIFDVKIAAVYLSDELDEGGTNVGEATPMIYLSPDCDGDIEGYQKTDLTYFHFAADQASVNEQINAHAEEIPALTYNYVRIEFYKTYDAETEPEYLNVKWGTAAFTHEFFYPTSTITVEFDEPLVVEGGDAVRVTLEYDFTNAITKNRSSDLITDDERNEDLYIDGSYYYHFVMPTFHPVAELIN